MWLSSCLSRMPGLCTVLTFFTRHAGESARSGQQRIAGPQAAAAGLQHAPAPCKPAPVCSAAGHDAHTGRQELWLLWLRPLLGRPELHIHHPPSFLAGAEDRDAVCHLLPSQCDRDTQVAHPKLELCTLSSHLAINVHCVSGNMIGSPYPEARPWCIPTA